MRIDVPDGAVRRARIASSIIDLVGTTPLVHLNRFSAAVGQRVYAKLEYLNPGGSIKDRPAKRIIQAGIDSGRINSDTVVIESSSGNLGIGLAQFCRYLGLRFVCVVDPNACEAKVSKIRTLGGEIRRVDHPDPITHEFLPARIALVQTLLRAEPNSLWPNQYANLDNAGSHHETVQEILSALDGAVDYLFVATSSCGTLRGCADYLREHGHTTKIIAVDAKGSHIFGAASGSQENPRIRCRIAASFVRRMCCARGREDLRHRQYSRMPSDARSGGPIYRWLVRRDRLGHRTDVLANPSRIHLRRGLPRQRRPLSRHHIQRRLGQPKLPHEVGVGCVTMAAPNVLVLTNGQFPRHCAAKKSTSSDRSAGGTSPTIRANRSRRSRHSCDSASTVPTESSPYLRPRPRLPGSSGSPPIRRISSGV